MRTRSAILFLAVATAACSGSSRPPETGGAQQPAPAPATSATKIVSFLVSEENLNVDKIGMRDGNLKPDGNRDHAFVAEIDGPVSALFIVETNQKGDPTYGFRADTLVAAEELPRELGGVVDTGTMTIGVGVVENGKFINGESGSCTLGEGVHKLKLYAPNTNTLQAGDFVRLYARLPGGAIQAGPVAPY